MKNKHNWQGIEITKNALKQILYLINSNPDTIGIKIGTKKSGCAGFRYTMKLIKKEVKKEKNDMIFNHNNVLIHISLEDIPLLNGIKIDFIKNNINKVFKYHNPKIEKFCGCGESFSIN